MNRPNRKDYKDNDCPTLEYDGVKYYQDLEKYCDQIEKKLNKYIREFNCACKYNREVVIDRARYQVALDKACLELVLIDNRFLPMTKEEWKEYLLKDE